MIKENKKSSILLLALFLVSLFGMTNCGATDAVCGNGTVEGTEACDDGNTAENDGCSSACALGPVSCSSTSMVLSGSYTSAQPITISGTCAMSGIVSVAAGNTITINAGSTILMDAGATPATVLIVEPGATINANGTAAQPVVFTSSATAPTYGDWGGVTIRGKATINTGAGASYTSEAEDGGTAGGSDDADNSGTLTYVRIEYGGKQMSSTKEYNGLTLEAVGNGTTIDNLHVHSNADDGIEFFGGTVNVKHVISTNNHDDMLDWTYGYRGKIQFALLGLYGGASDASMADSNFIEADSSDTNEVASPASQPTIYNLTALSDFNGQYKYMFRFRRGTGIKMYNAYVANACVRPSVESDQSNEALTGEGGANVGQAGVTTTLAAGNVVINNSLFENIAKATAPTSATCVEGTNATAVPDTAAGTTTVAAHTTDWLLSNYKDSAAVPAAYSLVAGAGLADFSGNVNVAWNALTTAGINPQDPMVSGSAFSPVPTASITTNAATPPNDGFFTTTATYIGAFSAADTWASWTAY